MRHAKIGSKLGVKADHRVAMLRNLSIGLVQHGRIKTTLPRAKKLRPFLEPIVTRLKNPTVANIRVAVSQLANREAVLQIVSTIAPKMANRPGGYLRIMKLSGHRAVDAADMALIEWSDEALVPHYNEAPVKKTPAKAKKKAAGKKASAKSAAGKAASGEEEKAPAKKKAKSAK